MPPLYTLFSSVQFLYVFTVVDASAMEVVPVREAISPKAKPVANNFLNNIPRL